MKLIIKLLIIITLATSQLAYSDEAKVCFYELADFRGESFCSTESESKSIHNDGFDNKIESISVPPGMVVTLYDGVNFSGKTITLKNDINLQELKSSGLYYKINSYQIAPAICFYTEDGYQGDSTCLAANQQIDLYHDTEVILESNRHVLPIHNDSIKSITIPQGMIAKIYKNDNFTLPFYALTENTTDNSLKALDMNNEITSIKAEEIKGLSCDKRCAIINSYDINLPYGFGEYWDDVRLLNKQVLFVFNTTGMGEDDNYDIKLFSGAGVIINKEGIIFSDHRMINKFYFERYKHSDNLSFIIQIKEDNVEIQYIQTLEHQLVDISPIISYDWSDKLNLPLDILITNYNIDKPLILAKTILTADTGDKKWEKRDLIQTSKIICAFTPFLNIYNYLIQGKCQQLDGIVFSASEYFNSNTQGKTLHIAGSSTPLKHKTETLLQTQESVDNHMTLTYIDNNQRGHSLSLPAVAKTCQTSLHSLFNSRPTRQLRPHCIDWTLEIMTDFTLLFGNSLETWNMEFFGRIINSIIKTGSTGVAVENTEIESSEIENSEVENSEVEKRFIKSVKEKIIEHGSENSFNYIKTAFDYAQLSYLSYKFYYSSDEMPSTVEQFPLGIYELLLETFNYVRTPPTVISQGDLVEQNELEFEVEILPTPTPEEEKKLSDTEVKNAQAMRKKLSETITHWGEQYQSTQAEQGSYAEQGASASANASPDENDRRLKKLLRAGYIVTGIINRRLILHRPGEIYVVIKLQGRIIAIVLADRFNNRDRVELVASVTLPDYVIYPDREGTVRGAGTAAVRELARYLQQQGARTLFSEVISQPSARVKQKVGFNFKNEF
ncbi:peptidase inhibitor family I36 protein [Yersinia enterocolitica]|uniref:peptidase inhibitor family I36 protein n=1 Tax=Yersinia enterocolitica TaxID=630 RepID=UPI00065A9133|nr:peptidase inhibitor family I36 protein [Yersinia enterocolitica]CRY01512.1 N-acetyltransferase GCN5 [Yersinia enterocolitica]